MINEIPEEMMPEMFVVPITVPPVTYAKVIIQGDNVTIEPRLKTNADRIRMMTDEEIAKVFTDDMCELLCNSPCVCDGQCESHMLTWLKRECSP